MLLLWAPGSFPHLQATAAHEKSSLQQGRHRSCFRLHPQLPKQCQHIWDGAHSCGRTKEGAGCVAGGTEIQAAFGLAGTATTPSGGREGEACAQQPGAPGFGGDDLLPRVPATAHPPGQGQLQMSPGELPLFKEYM
ncbi:hypothetical protein VULLAG_LOCUS4701 [Vulpes lagopus]